MKNTLNVNTNITFEEFCQVINNNNNNKDLNININFEIHFNILKYINSFENYIKTEKELLNTFEEIYKNYCG